MKHVLERKQDCVGCGFCAYICPVGAISITQDEGGFYYPSIDEDKCIRCLNCSNKCPQKAYREQKDTMLTCIAKHRDDSELKKSTSGAFFYALCEYVIKNEGVVYGAGFGSEMRVELHRAITLEECNELRGSKYVQCDMHNCYELVIYDLNENKLVLFSGTPCMVNAILHATNEIQRNNLITFDVVCNGVSSPMAWSLFVHDLEKEYGQMLIYYKFRSKENGYLSKDEVAYFENGDKSVLSWGTDKYTMLVYYTNRAMRQACSNCHFATLNRVSDFSSGDCSHLVDKYNDFIGSNGASIILVNTEIGKRLLPKLSSYVRFISIPVGKAKSVRLEKPIEKSSVSKQFIKDINKKGLRKATRKQVGYLRWYKSILHKHLLKVFKCE